MKKFKELRLTYQAIRVYILSLLASLLASPLFGKLYIKVFNPRFNEGLFPSPRDPLFLFQGFILSYFLVLTFFTFLFIEKNKYLIWIIGICLPLLMMFVNGKKTFFYSLLLSFLGWLLAQVILFLKKKKDG